MADAAPGSAGPLPIAAIALDLDGTLLRSDKTVDDRTVATLRALAARGVQLVIATGRMTPAVLHVEARLGVPCALVTYNGACAYAPGARDDAVERSGSRDVAAGEPAAFPDLAGLPHSGRVVAPADRVRLFHRPVPAPAAEAIVRWCEANGVAVNIYVDDRLFIHADPRFHAPAARYAAMTGCVYDKVDSYDGLLRGPAPTKLLVFCDESDAAVDALYRALAAVVPPGSVHLIRAEFFVEAVAADVNKGLGLAECVAALGIPLAEVVAFGDGENDVEMLRSAGLGVAMRNGRPQAHAAARMVTDATNDDDGVGRQLTRLLEDGTVVVRPRPTARKQA